MRATLLLTLFAVCLLPSTAAAASVGDTSIAHHDVETDGCPSSLVEAECKACGRRASGDSQLYVNRCCSDMELYSSCRDHLDTKATQSKSLAKRSIDQLGDYNDDIQEEKRRNPFLGKRANPFLGKRKVNPFLGKRRTHAPFLGKRLSDDLDEVFAKRRMPFLG